MSEPTGITRRADLRDYLAAERTLLAWLRTGLALMGFGFVVARFGIFLRQFQLVQRGQLETSYGLSLWFGTTLIAVGVLVNLFSGWQYARLVRELDRGDAAHSRPATFVLTIAVFLAMVGLAMAIYLVSVRGSVYFQSFENKSGKTIMSATDKGIIDVPSRHSVDETVQKLTGILEAKGITLFALVDHSGEAAKVGMKMRPTKLAIFGNPKAGTPLMLAAPSSAIDLPLKILIWEDSQARVWVSYNSPAYLEGRHGLPHELVQNNIEVIETLAAKVAE